MAFSKVTFLVFIAAVSVQVITSGSSLFSKASIQTGLKPSIITTYAQGIGFLFMAPLGYFFERQTAPPLSFKVVCKIIVISTFGLSLNLILFYSALNYASATFVIAMDNTIPVVVFVMALLFRVERLSISKWHGKAKVIGCVVSVSGAMLLTFFKGPAVYHIGNKTADQSPTTTTGVKEDWVKGFFLMFSSNMLSSFWAIMQGFIIKEYPAQLRLTALECLFSSIVAALWSAATQRDASAWKLGWDINLISVLYNGILFGGLLHWLLTWVVKKRGAVFACIFVPLALVLTAFLSALIFKEILHLGSVLGAIVIVGGLYVFLWGQSREAKALVTIEEKEKQGESDGVALECITTESDNKEADVALGINNNNTTNKLDCLP